MADTTTPITPTPQTPEAIPSALDLEINLEDAPKVEENIAPENKESDLNLDLDLNLSDAPKDDDRLKAEDQKNNETEQPIKEEPVTEQPTSEPVTETPKEQPINIPVIEEIPETKTEVTPETKTEEIPSIEPIAEIPSIEPLTQETPIEETIEETIEPTTEPITETITETTPEVTPETKTEDMVQINELESTKNIPEASSLQKDQEIISQLENHESAGGLAPEAKKEPQTPTIDEPTTKTFDLDSMLGTQNINIPTPQTEQTVPQTEIPTPQTPIFSIPTPQTPAPAQAILQTEITPQNKTTGIKIGLFVTLFVLLGFTSFFILKTMYPVEFDNMFGGNTQMHASEEIITGDINTLSGTETTGDITEIGEITGTIEDNTFGELNDLETEIDNTPEQTDISRLTEYASKGNTFLAQGKSMGNNTIVKYGLYISKKATTFLEKIANGEEINNLTGYFAQFDQYIGQLETLMGQSTQTPTTETQQVSPSTTTNDQAMNQEPTIPTIDPFASE